jgi:hypothetical protein
MLRKSFLHFAASLLSSVSLLSYGPGPRRTIRRGGERALSYRHAPHDREIKRRLWQLWRGTLRTNA